MSAIIFLYIAKDGLFSLTRQALPERYFKLFIQRSSYLLQKLHRWVVVPAFKAGLVLVSSPFLNAIHSYRRIVLT